MRELSFGLVDGSGKIYETCFPLDMCWVSVIDSDPGDLGDSGTQKRSC